MRNLARLILFFTLGFVILFAAAFFLLLLSSWVDAARFIPIAAKPGEDAAEMAWKVLPIALYLSVLLTLSYSVRRKMPVPLTIIGIVVLGTAAVIGSSLGITRAAILQPAIAPAPAISGGPGLIFSQRDTAMVLLKESSETRGPRVVSIPGQPLIYQEAPLGPNNTILNLPALPFAADTPWFIRSLGIDFSLCSGELNNRYTRNMLSFAAYVFALVLLLGSLRFVLELSQWHLANLIIGALVFRGILALEIFLNSGEINALINTFLSGRVPLFLVTPLVFAALAVLIILYTLLTRLTKSFGRSADSEQRRSRDG